MTKSIAIFNPQIITRERELVLIPKAEYQALLRIKQKGIAEVSLNARQRRAIERSENEIRKGDYLTLNGLETYLDRARAKARR